MTPDDGRAAERRRRMDELLAQAGADVDRTRAARTGPAEEKAGGTWWGSALGVLILLVLAALLGGAAVTISRFTGPDYNAADRQGTATVQQCQRFGPITWQGFGFY